jgi:hypothetical protein
MLPCYRITKLNKNQPKNLCSTQKKRRQSFSLCVLKYKRKCPKVGLGACVTCHAWVQRDDSRPMRLIATKSKIERDCCVMLHVSLLYVFQALDTGSMWCCFANVDAIVLAGIRGNCVAPARMVQWSKAFVVVPHYRH